MADIAASRSIAYIMARRWPVAPITPLPKAKPAVFLAPHGAWVTAAIVERTVLSDPCRNPLSNGSLYAEPLIRHIRRHTDRNIILVSVGGSCEAPTWFSTRIFINGAPHHSGQPQPVLETNGLLSFVFSDRGIAVMPTKEGSEAREYDAFNIELSIDPLVFYETLLQIRRDLLDINRAQTIEAGR